MIRSRLLATESLSYNNNVQGLYPGVTCIWRWISSSVRRPYGRFEIMTRRCSHVHHLDVQNNCSPTVRRGNFCWGSFPVARRREVLAGGGGQKLQVFTIFILIRAIWWLLRGKIHAIRCYISIKTVCNLSYFIFPLSLPLSLSSLKTLKKGVLFDKL